MLAFADDEEDAEIAGLGRRVRVLADGKLQSPLYLGMFPEAPSEATEGLADDRQRAFAEQILQTLREDPAYASLRDLLPGLEAARAEVVAARANLNAAIVAENKAWNDVQLAEAEARTAYNTTHPKLAILFPGRKRLVESFFYKAPKKRKVVD
jgi:hypothetical protein